MTQNAAIHSLCEKCGQALDGGSMLLTSDRKLYHIHCSPYDALREAPVPSEEPVARHEDGRRIGHSKLVYNKATRTIDTIRTPVASPAVAPVASVKGLEWTESDGEWFADDMRYRIRKDTQAEPDLYIVSGWTFGTNPYETLVAAKAAAQADFNTRIRSSIIPATKGGEDSDCSKWLGELLATIHRDGGQYQALHGDEKAVADAHAILAAALAGNAAEVASGDLMDSDYARDIMQIVPATPPVAPTGTVGSDGPWCQPMKNGEHQPRQFIVYFEDASVGIAAFDNEADARQHWEAANLNWNCYLFGALPRVASPAVAPVTPDEFWGSPGHERNRMLARIAELEKALKDIAFLRPPGPTENKLAERMERIALDATAKVTL